MNKKQIIQAIQALDPSFKAGKLKIADLRAALESAQDAADPARHYMPRQDLAKILKGFAEGMKPGEFRDIPAADLRSAGICESGCRYPAYWASSNNTGRKALIKAGLKGSFASKASRLRISMPAKG